ncbi:DUF115 domain-containing protein [Paenibacillus sp. alder61]|uniref:Motility associated factor glycosyltransferase family protein n=1 Tax=Paenibacillus faecis TaxID=862114 RepID=A0A5D0CSS8_9BACL|nr:MULTISPECIES: 6-hydroxymethylpterin diphosphokinase MptE-like protein [Paenibacillus]MCA1293985.1 DUF115 domain-containing protein [Paenibacillus sp. alder61]TYA11867.1 motility associated factor glycosyltransferase family protein [Paenibacillus faecis]
MNVFENNIKFFKQSYPDLLPLLNEEEEQRIGYKYTKTLNDEVNLIVKQEGKDIHLHSKYNATEEARKWLASKRELKEANFILLFGMGMGYFLEAVLALSHINNIVIYEPDRQIFRKLIESRDITKLFSNKKIKAIAVGADEFIRLQLAYHISENVSESFLVLAPPVYQKLYATFLEELTGHIKEAFANQITNFHTLQSFQTAWLENVLFSLPYTLAYPTASFLKNAFEDCKVIIVGSGPSLKEDIHYLSELRDKCFIIAAGSSIQALQHYGIKPHLVISIDGGLPNYKVFENVDTTQVPLLFISQIHYGILDIYRTNMMYGMFNNKLSSYLYEDKDVPVFVSTMSVTGTAIQVAKYVGAKEIILMGQDLSYPKKEFYSPGVNHISQETKDIVLQSAQLWVDNVDGDQNPTTESMLSTLKDIEMLIKVVNLDEVNIINTSKHGAKIEGTLWESMDKLYKELLELPSKNYDNIFEANQSNPNYLVETTKIINKLNQSLKETNKISKKIIELKEAIDKLSSKRGNSKDLNRALLKVNDSWKWITNKEVFKTFYSFSLEQYINIYLRYVPTIVETQDPYKKSALIVKHLGSLLTKIIEFTPHLIVILENAIARLEKKRLNNLGERDDRIF